MLLDNHLKSSSIFTVTLYRFTDISSWGIEEKQGLSIPISLSLNLPVSTARHDIVRLR